MVNEGGKSPNVEIRVIFGEQAEIVREKTHPLGETCAEPGFVVRTLKWFKVSALHAMESRGWFEAEEVPTGLEYQVGLPAGFSYRGPLPPNAISIEPFLPKKPDTNPPETDGLPN